MQLAHERLMPVETEGMAVAETIPGDLIARDE
jgi:hypothetical protein